MPTSARTFGFELEYASGVQRVIDALRRLDPTIIRTEQPHSYHCDCENCSFRRTEQYVSDDEGEGYRMVDPSALRCQRDSTADGEFITKIISDWDDFAVIANALTSAASQAEATTSNRCGLHVHVGVDVNEVGIDARHTTVPAAYLAFERYFTEIVAPGASVRKRDMNSTLMQALRQYVSDNFGSARPDAWLDLGRGQLDEYLRQAIARDRHVDLNWSRRNGTWEFRVFNATNAAWRIELACRMAVAFVEQTPALRDAVDRVVRGSKFWPERCDSPWGEIARPAWSELPAPHPTKRPVVPMAEFVDILCDADPDLRPLIDRQANFMRTRWAHEVEAAA